MVINIGNGFSKPKSNPGWVCISLHGHNLGKSMNPSVLLPAMGK